MHFLLSKVPSDMNQVSLFFVTVLFPKPSQLKLGQLPFSHCFFSFSQSPTQLQCISQEFQMGHEFLSQKMAKISQFQGDQYRPDLSF